jgi:hypothetical protein
MKIDFVAKDPSANVWRMVMVEQGPWQGPLEQHLQKLQEKLYNYVDAAIDGELARNFPESTGKDIIIQVDFYDVPEDSVRTFFCNFADGVFRITEYKKALSSSRFVNKLEFEITFDHIH